MTDHTSGLVHRYLDGMLTEGEEAELNAWVKAAPENARELAGVVLLHDRLQGVLKVRSTVGIEPKSLADARPSLRSARFPTRRFAGILSGLAALVVISFAVVWWGGATRVSAATELDRLIESADTRDRSYVINNLDDRPEQPEDRRPPIDGAELHVRYPDRYVLVRRFPNGDRFVTGSDGERSWSVPPTEPVRVSADPLRFRGPVPGNQYGIPFVNLRSDLVQLREAYVLTSLGADAAASRGLRAEKKSPEYRGPNQVELWYDPATGVIRRMVFGGMPKARGGPDRVSVELTEQRNLGADYFRHESHHAADRRVIEED